MMARLAALLAGWLLLGDLALAQSQAELAAERVRIVRERIAVQAEFDRLRRDCESRFAATACLDAARAQRRAGLDVLARQQGVMDAAQRRQRAAERMKRIEQRMAADDKPLATAGPAAAKVRPAMAPPRARVPRAADVMPPSAASAPAGRTSQPRASRPRTQPLSPQQQAANRQAFQDRLARAEAHRAEVQQRNARRAAKRGTPVLPLPAPPKGSEPAAR
jgi:hypothetical protein